MNRGVDPFERGCILRSVKDLEPELKREVVELCQKGMDQADIERYEVSNRTFAKVYDLLPEPKEEWKAYAWLQASRGDNCFELKEYAEALDFFKIAVDSDSDYRTNGFVRMRIGQCLYELKQKEEAEVSLKLAYELGGEDIFEDEKAVYKKIALREGL